MKDKLLIYTIASWTYEDQNNIKKENFEIDVEFKQILKTLYDIAKTNFPEEDLIIIEIKNSLIQNLSNTNKFLFNKNIKKLKKSFAVIVDDSCKTNYRYLMSTKLVEKYLNYIHLKQVFLNEYKQKNIKELYALKLSIFLIIKQILTNKNILKVTYKKNNDIEISHSEFFDESKTNNYLLENSDNDFNLINDISFFYSDINKNFFTDITKNISLLKSYIVEKINTKYQYLNNENTIFATFFNDKNTIFATFFNGKIDIKIKFATFLLKEFYNKQEKIHCNFVAKNYKWVYNFVANNLNINLNKKNIIINYLDNILLDENKGSNNLNINSILNNKYLNNIIDKISYKILNFINTYKFNYEGILKLEYEHSTQYIKNRVIKINDFCSKKCSKWNTYYIYYIYYIYNIINYIIINIINKSLITVIEKNIKNLNLQTGARDDALELENLYSACFGLSEFIFYKLKTKLKNNFTNNFILKILDLPNEFIRDIFYCECISYIRGVYFMKVPKSKKLTNEETLKSTEQNLINSSKETSLTDIFNLNYYVDRNSALKDYLLSRGVSEEKVKLILLVYNTYKLKNEKAKKEINFITLHHKDLSLNLIKNCVDNVFKYNKSHEIKLSSLRIEEQYNYLKNNDSVKDNLKLVVGGDDFNKVDLFGVNLNLCYFDSLPDQIPNKSFSCVGSSVSQDLFDKNCSFDNKKIYNIDGLEIIKNDLGNYEFKNKGFNECKDSLGRHVLLPHNSPISGFFLKSNVFTLIRGTEPEFPFIYLLCGAKYNLRNIYILSKKKLNIFELDESYIFEGSTYKIQTKLINKKNLKLDKLGTMFLPIESKLNSLSIDHEEYFLAYKITKDEKTIENYYCSYFLSEEKNKIISFDSDFSKLFCILIY